MTFRSPLFTLAVGASLCLLVVLPHQVVAQPDAGPRNIVPSAPMPPLSSAEIEKGVGGPTTVTYSGRSVAVAEVIKVLLNVAGQDVSWQNLTAPEITAAPRISVDWKDKPFWDAAREVETLTGMRWSQTPQGGMALVRAAVSDGANLNGQLLVDSPYVKIHLDCVTHTAVSRTISAEANALVAANDTVRLRAFAYFDPKLKVQGGTLEIRDIRLPTGTALPQEQTFATGGPTQAMRPFDWRNNGVGGSRRGFSLLEPLTIELPNGLSSGTTISKISATARFTTALGDKKWVIDDLLNAADAQEVFEKAIYTVIGATVEGNQLKVRLQVERDKRLAGKEGGLDNVPTTPFDMGAANAVGDNFILNGFGGNMGRMPNQMGSFRTTPQSRAFSEMRVRDANGRLLNSQGMSSNNSSGENRTKTETTFTYNLGETPAKGPFSMEWNLPSEPRTVDIPFELKNVHIP